MNDLRNAQTDRRETRKRLRSAVRTEMMIFGDYVLDALIPVVDEASEEAQAPLVSVDWIRHALVEKLDRDAIQAHVRKALEDAEPKRPAIEQ